MKICSSEYGWSCAFFRPIRFREIVILLKHMAFTFTTIIVRKKSTRCQPLCFEICATPNCLQIINTYLNAVHTVDPKLAVGELHTLWVAFAKFYEENKQYGDADKIFEKATEVAYQRVDDLASVWCEWADMKMRLK